MLGYFLQALLAAALIATSGQARAADYPEREIRLVVPIEPGGIIDSIASPLTAQLQESAKQPVRSGIWAMT